MNENVYEFQLIPLRSRRRRSETFWSISSERRIFFWRSSDPRMLGLVLERIRGSTERTLGTSDLESFERRPRKMSFKSHRHLQWRLETYFEGSSWGIRGAVLKNWDVLSLEMLSSVIRSLFVHSFVHSFVVRSFVHRSCENHFDEGRLWSSLKNNSDKFI